MFFLSVHEHHMKLVSFVCVCVCVAFVCFDHRFSLVVVWCFLLLVYFFLSLILHGYSCMVFLLDSTLTGCNCATFRNCAF